MLQVSLAESRRVHARAIGVPWSACVHNRVRAVGLRGSILQWAKNAEIAQLPCIRRPVRIQCGALRITKRVDGPGDGIRRTYTAGDLVEVAVLVSLPIAKDAVACAVGQDDGSHLRAVTLELLVPEEEEKCLVLLDGAAHRDRIFVCILPIPLRGSPNAADDLSVVAPGVGVQR